MSLNDNWGPLKGSRGWYKVGLKIDVMQRPEHNYQCHFEVYSRYMLLWLYWEYGTIMWRILQAPTLGEGTKTYGSQPSHGKTNESRLRSLIASDYHKLHICRLLFSHPVYRNSREPTKHMALLVEGRFPGPTLTEPPRLHSKFGAFLAQLHHSRHLYTQIQRGASKNGGPPPRCIIQSLLYRNPQVGTPISVGATRSL